MGPHPAANLHRHLSSVLVQEGPSAASQLPPIHRAPKSPALHPNTPSDFLRGSRVGCVPADVPRKCDPPPGNVTRALPEPKEPPGGCLVLLGACSTMLMSCAGVSMCPRGTCSPSVPAEKLAHRVAATTHRLGVLAAVSGPGFKQRIWTSSGVLARGLAAANTSRGAWLYLTESCARVGEHKAASGAAFPHFSGELQSPDPTKQQQPLAPLPCRPDAGGKAPTLSRGCLETTAPSTGLKQLQG